MTIILLKYKGERLMRKTMVFMMILLLASLVSFQNAFGASKAAVAISPYIQTDNDSTYTFVGITHPSLSTAGTQIGLTVATVGLDGATPSTTFTIGSGETYRIFIVSTNHSSINSDTVTGARVIFLSTTTGTSTNGQLLLTSNMGNQLARSPRDLRTHKSEALNQLTMWGAIVIPSTSTGFAMEFIGDAHDSIAIKNSLIVSNVGDDSGITGRYDNSVGAGRGVN